MATKCDRIMQSFNGDVDNMNHFKMTLQGSHWIYLKARNGSSLEKMLLFIHNSQLELLKFPSSRGMVHASRHEHLPPEFDLSFSRLTTFHALELWRLIF